MTPRDVCPCCGREFPLGDPRASVRGRQCFDCDERDAAAVARVREHVRGAVAVRVALDDAEAAQVTPCATIVEASSLGLAPGVWPLRLTHSGVLFIRDRVLTALSGDVIEVHYRPATGAGASLHVLND